MRNLPAGSLLRALMARRTERRKERERESERARKKMSFIHRKYRQRTLTIVTQATQQEKNQIRDASCVPEMEQGNVVYPCSYNEYFI